MPQKFKPLPPESAIILERSRGVFFARWGELLRLRRVVLESSSSDDIHDLRVASRRFRAVLELLYPFLPESDRVRLKKNIRKITRTLGRLRNIDEAQLFIQARGAEIPGADAICKTVSTLRAEELQHVLRVIGSFEHHLLDNSVRQMVSDLNDETVVSRNRFSLLSYLSEASIRHYIPVHTSISSATQPEHSSARHSLRIAIKKWRYFLEIVEQILDCDYSAVLKQLKEYQALLGQMNDIKEFEVLLGSLKISKVEQNHIKKIFAQEEAELLNRFRQIMEQKPLAYVFII